MRWSLHVVFEEIPTGPVIKGDYVLGRYSRVDVSNKLSVSSFREVECDFTTEQTDRLRGLGAIYFKKSYERKECKNAKQDSIHTIRKSSSETLPVLWSHP